MDGRILSLGFGACLGSFWVGSVWIASECNLRQCFSQLWTSASEKGRLEPPSEPGAQGPDGGECRTIGSRRGLGPARDVAVAKVVEGRHAIGCNMTCSNRPPLKCIVQPLQSSDGMFVSRKHSRRSRGTRPGRPRLVSLQSRLLSPPPSYYPPAPPPTPCSRALTWVQVCCFTHRLPLPLKERLGRAPWSR